MAARYDPVAMTLHWVIALSIIIMIPLGLYMDDLPVNVKFDAYIFHKSLGITILGLSLLRLVWRLLNPPPELPAHMNALEKLAARVSHWLFYFLMIAMPLTGWLMVSASKKFPTVYFWVGEVPFLPLPEAYSGKDAAHLFNTYHEYLAYGALILLVLHVGAALKHHFIDRDTVLVRMLPRFISRSPHA